MPTLIISRLCPKVSSLPTTLRAHGKLTKERIAQRHLLNAPHVRIIDKVRVDVEEHRHIHRLARIQPLLLKAEALDLAEIRRNLARRHAVCRYPDDILVALVRRRVERQRRLAWEHLDLALLRREFPREYVRH